MQSSDIPAFPPLDGSISVLPGFVDFHAAHNPDRPFAVFPPSPDLSVSAVSFAEFAQATHRVARALQPDGHARSGEVVAILVNCDALLYVALIVGAVRAGLVPFPMSPRNSVPAITNLLQKTGCHRILSQPSLSALTHAVQTALAGEPHALAVHDIPDLDAVYPTLRGGSEANFAPYDAPRTVHKKDDVVLYLHSSGSTGLPKAIPQRAVHILQACTTPCVFDGRAHGMSWASMALPTFHTAGMYRQLYTPLTTGYAVGLYAPTAPAPPVAPTPENVLAACRATACNGVSVVPTFVTAWAHSAENVRYLASLKAVGFAGGPLAKTTGDQLVAAGVNLVPIYGGTEYGVWTRVFDVPAPSDDPHAKTRDDWEWLSFPDHLALRWVPEGDGTYELQFLTSEAYVPCLENLPDVRGYATGDLLQPHPTKKGLWRVTGRKDDVIVLGSGEKVVPVPQEGFISSNPLVAGAVMFGREKDQCGILIEPAAGHEIDPSDQVALVALRNKIWPTVDTSNQTAPGFGRIFKEMIIVTEPSRPLPRAAKGTIVRKMAWKLYSDEIERLYQTVEASGASRDVSPPVSWTVADLEPWLLKQVASLKGELDISASSDLFTLGFDSLDTTFLRNRIIGAMRVSIDPKTKQAAVQVPQNFIFEHPTVQDLAKATALLVEPTQEEHRRDAVEEMRSMIEKYTRDLPEPQHASLEPPKNIAVLLTGSTGSVGSNILATLLEDPHIHSVYTLNRSSSQTIVDRQRAAFTEQGLPLELLANSKLHSLTGDVSLENFGLPDSATMEELRRSVTHVVHNAWKVDFNLSLWSFEEHIAGVRKLLAWCSSTQHPVKLLYTSSIASAQAWEANRGPVPDAPLADPSCAVGSGYGESKFVAENILAAARKTGLETTTLRIGQVCGSSRSGAWSTREWFPILVKSSRALGALPDLDGLVSWIPMDALVAVVRDCIISREELPVLLNVVHPRPTRWHSIIEAVGTDEGVPLVEYGEWLRRLETAAENASGETIDAIPAIKIIEFFRRLAGPSGRKLASPEFGTDLLLRHSSSIHNLGPIAKHHVNMWLRCWKETGFIA